MKDKEWIPWIIIQPWFPNQINRIIKKNNRIKIMNNKKI